MIIGITGKARSGKDTAGRYIREKYLVPTLAFADPLKEAAMAMFGLTREMVYGLDGYDRERLVPGWGISVREMLQKLGTECARHVFCEDFWVKRMEATISGGLSLYKQGFVVTDVRFDNEAAWIQKKGGAVICVRGGFSVPGDNHLSEEGVNPMLIDAVIDNCGTLEDFHIKLDEALYEAGYRAKELP